MIPYHYNSTTLLLYLLASSDERLTSPRERRSKAAIAGERFELPSFRWPSFFPPLEHPASTHIIAAFNTPTILLEQPCLSRDTPSRTPRSGEASLFHPALDDAHEESSQDRLQGGRLQEQDDGGL
jgi:hypothetical protein